MNYSRKQVNLKDIALWINQALEEETPIIAICMDEESHESTFEPRYLKKEEALQELIKLINQDEERYSLRFVIDVEKEIQKCLDDGTGLDIDYEKAQKLFPKLKR